MAAITVNNFMELRNAIADTVSTEIYLGQDITFTASGGALIPRTKGDIVIDGNGFKITDYASSAFGDTIRVASSSATPMTVTIRNIVWNGRNFYGIIGMENGSSTANVTLVLNNVQYTGPQAIYHRQYITRVINSDFSIEKIGSVGSNPQEFGEVNSIFFSGTVTINSFSDSDSVIWFLNSGAAFNVEENARLTINAPNTYMFYIDSTAARPNMIFAANSVTKINTQHGLFFDGSTTLHMAATFKVAQGASFSAVQAARNGSVPAFKCRDSFTMEEGSFLLLAMPSSGTSALMYFPLRIDLSFNNPKSVILYNNGGRLFSFGAGTSASPDTINIKAELINMWTAAKTPFEDAGKFDDTPASAFSKADGSYITATAYTTTAATSSVTSNIVSGDKGFPMSTANFNVMQARVMSMGNVNISLNDISDASAAITGVTESLANVKAFYGSTTVSGRADDTGAINLPVSSIPADTIVTFASNWNFLIKEIQTTVAGSVRITHLTDLVFKSFAVPYKRGVVKRKDTNWYLEITDTRTVPSCDWYLYASIPAPLSSGSDTLDNAMTYNIGTYVDIMSDTPVLIRQGTWSSPVPKITRIEWEELEGFLLRVNPDFVYNYGRYTTRLDWDIRLAPLD